MTAPSLTLTKRNETGGDGYNLGFELVGHAVDGCDVTSSAEIDGLMAWALKIAMDYAGELVAGPSWIVVAAPAFNSMFTFRLRPKPDSFTAEPSAISRHSADLRRRTREQGKEMGSIVD